MRIEQRIWTAEDTFTANLPILLGSAQLVLLFAATRIIKTPGIFEIIKKYYPHAYVIGCSTAGEIYGTQVFDDSMVTTAVEFAHTRIKGCEVNLSEVETIFEAGERLAHTVPKKDLVHLFLLSEGLDVNGSELAEGLTRNLPDNVSVTGGLAGDGNRFEETLVVSNKAPEKDTITMIGLYSKNLKVGYGSRGGWDPFGPERLITRSEGNILYEMDDRSALELYKLYLGEQAKELPASAMLFPLSIRTDSGDLGVVRTVLAINENNKSMTFAGNIPQGSYARMMKANFDRLIDGAMVAAVKSQEPDGCQSPDLAILISCVGRKLVLKQRTEEEIEVVQEILGNQAVLAGFYSYGEICPFKCNDKPELHNQTMTITTFTEV